MQRIVRFAALVAFAVSACSSSTPTAPVSQFDQGGGHGGPRYDPPIRHTQGEYHPPAREPKHEASARAALLQESQRSRFEGWRGGIYVYPPGSVPPPTVGKPLCSNSELRQLSTAEIAGSGYAIPVPGYLLPGAVEREGQWGTACPIGEPVLITRRFSFEPGPAELIIIRYPGMKAIEFETSETRVSSGSVRDKQAVFIAPITTHGLGVSAILINEQFGVTQVGAIDVPFNELLKMAQSL